MAPHLNYWFRLSLPLHLRPAAQETFHTAVGIFAALLYAAFFHRRLPGPGWFRGLVFCQLLWAAQSLVVLPWLGKGYFGQGISASAPVWSWCLNAVFGIVLWAAAAGLLPLPSGAATGAEPGSIAPSNGSTDPFPIPWLDKNGDRNQPAKPDQEPSHIYGFKGRVARCSTFTGMGTDNQGNRIVFGSPTTDYGFTQGEYFAGRSPQADTFSPI